MRIALANMPWATTDVPSLALGILATRVHETFAQADVQTIQANLDYVDWASEKIGLDGAEYSFFAEASYFSGCGDWIFSSALYGDRNWRVAEFEQSMAPGLPKYRRDIARKLHELAPDAVEHLVAIILDKNPDIVGFTSTFQQNTASLAAARRIKELAPQVTTVLGGANCDGSQGSAIHRNFPFVDFVVRGEGEAAFPALLASLAGDGAAADIPGLCYRAGDGTPAANPMAARPIEPAQIARPDYASYFERFALSMARSWADPKLTVEGSRGCWWGEKHHCTFCGLNGSFMAFRGKRPEVFLDEIMTLVRRHQVLDIVVVDNIMEMGYLGSLLPALAEADCDLRIHYEIKANLRRPQLQALHDAGVILVQPGIESFSSHVLKLMNKGVTGCLNMRLLRDAESVGIAPSWNYLYGFPGERPSDYAPIIEQLPALHHLPPPAGCSRIGIERFSPYFARPELGFTPLRPAPQYSVTYDLPQGELNDLAYLFSAPDRGIGDDLAELLTESISDWASAHCDSRLTHCDRGDEIVLVNRREGFPWEVVRLGDPVELAAFRLLDQPRTVPALTHQVRGQTRRPVAGDEIGALLARWQRLGVLFAENDHFIQIAPEATNRELTRINRPTVRSRE
jgi:ribosomal peptide maturation radical SAM protein 1